MNSLPTAIWSTKWRGVDIAVFATGDDSPLTLAAVGGNVVLQADRDIYVRDAIVLTAAGAGLSATAGGVLFNAGSIINTAGITTNGGAVTLRGNSISGDGGITTQGGAVDLMTVGSLNYSSAIASGGGAVTLGSQNSSVNSANVNAGSGTISVTGRSVSSGSYTTTGTAGFTATAGNIFVNNVNANVVNLNATGVIGATVAAGERVNAASSGSYVELFRPLSRQEPRERCGERCKQAPVAESRKSRKEMPLWPTERCT